MKENKIKSLNQENKLLRSSLRIMNTYLSEFLEMLKDNRLKKVSSMGYKYGQNGRLKKTEDQQIKNLSFEETNYTKMLQKLE